MLLVALASPAAELTLRAAHGSDAEKQTVAQLERLSRTYDLSRWTVTRDIVIEEGEVPHSHPMLTLNTRHLRNDERLLSTFVHEQMHWFLAEHPEQTASATAALRRLFPETPVGYPEGSDTEAVNYEHLLVVYLEYLADQSLLGEPKAREVMQFWAGDHYRWIYRQVLDDPEKVGAVVKAYGLLPKG